ncbi:MAG: 50S ribosomal protein L23 [Spirochaetales bacterium]|nr:50S ribosomal protein L23 [Spirochaetales bacterium]
MEFNEDIIIEPIVTEKSNTMRERNKYGFKVDSRSNKKQIKRAIEVLFNVRPLKCNIINCKRKPRRVRYQPGYTATWKKAIVTLREGEKISIFEGV